MTMLPYQQGDIVRWRDEEAAVVEVRGERVVVVTADRMVHITTEEILRAMQPPGRKAGAA